MAVSIEDLVAAGKEKESSGVSIEALVRAAREPDTNVPQLNAIRPDSVQASREAGRPNLVNELQREVTKPYGYDPGANLVKAGVTGLKTIGAGSQVMENQLAAPAVNAVRRMRGEEVGPVDTFGAELGQTKAEFGDIFREMGIPEWTMIPSVGGLAMASVFDPTQAGYKVGSKIAGAVTDAGSTVTRGLKHIFNVVGLGHNPKESKHLNSGGYKNLTEDIMKYTDEVSQDTSNAMIAQWRDRFMAPRQRLYDVVGENIGKTNLPSEASEVIAESVQAVLDKELNKNASAKAALARTGVRKAINKVTRTKEKIEYPSSGITATTSGVTEKSGNTARAGAVEQKSIYNPNTGKDIGPFTTKITTKTSKTLGGRKPDEGLELYRLVEQAKKGQPVTAKDWYAAAQAVKNISGDDQAAVVGGKVSRAIEEVLRPYVTGLDSAMKASADENSAREALENIVGKWDNKDFVAQDGTKILDYFKKGAGSPTQTSMREFEALSKSRGGKSFTGGVRDLAAYKTSVPPYRPALTALSLGGGAGILLHQAGVPAPVIAAVGGLAAMELTPYLSAKSGKFLATQAARVKRFINTPAGSFLMTRAPKDALVKVLEEGAGRALSQGALKGAQVAGQTASQFIQDF